MHPYFDDYWPWYVASWSLAIPGAIFLLWGLFRDRAKRRGLVRRRCPKCWYDMTGVADLDPLPVDTKCPECGQALRRVRDMHRTRRHGKVIFAAVIMFVAAYGLHCVPRMKAHARRNPGGAWAAFVPSSLIIFAPLPEWDETDSSFSLRRKDGVVWGEFNARHFRDGVQLWSWQEQVLAWRVRRHLKNTTRYGISDEERETLGRLVTSTCEWPPSFDDFDMFATKLHEVSAVPLVVRGDLDPYGDLKIPPGLTSVWSMLDAGVGEHVGSDGFYWTGAWTIEGNQVLITPEDAMWRNNRTVMYDTTDLVSSAEDIDQLANIIQDLVAPNHWRDLGGDLGRLGCIADHLIIETSVRHHLYIEHLLATLHGEQSQFVLNPPYRLQDDQGWSESFVTIVTRLYEIGDLATSDDEVETLLEIIYFLLDDDHWRDLGGEVGSIAVLDSRLVVTSTGSIHEHLDQLLSLLRDRGAGSITTPPPINPNRDLWPMGPEIRCYVVDQLAPSDEARDALADHVAVFVGPEHWLNLGGEGSLMLTFDTMLVVATRVDLHEVVARRLEEIRSSIASGRDLESIIEEWERREFDLGD